MGTPVNKLKQQGLDNSESNNEDLFDNTLKELGEKSISEECKDVPNGDISENTSENSSNVSNIVKDTLKKQDTLSSIEANEQAEKMVEQILNKKTRKTTLQRILDDSKEPILVVILFILFNTGFFSKLLLKYLPKLFGNANNGLNYSGILVHSILFGFVFYILKKLLS